MVANLVIPACAKSPRTKKLLRFVMLKLLVLETRCEENCKVK